MLVVAGPAASRGWWIGPVTTPASAIRKKRHGAPASRRSLEASAVYQAACEGSPLRTAEARNKAMEDGYAINRRHDCIDKASFAAIASQKARWEAANTPEARARAAAGQQQELAAAREPGEDRRGEAHATAGRRHTGEGHVLLESPYTAADVNTSTEADIAAIIGVGPEIAAQIVVQRNARPFRDWPDLIDRIIGLHAAKSAVLASIGGLTVQGASVEGVARDPVLATLMRDHEANIVRQHAGANRK